LLSKVDPDHDLGVARADLPELNEREASTAF
jgi:hypothetical protein